MGKKSRQKTWNKEEQLRALIEGRLPRRAPTNQSAKELRRVNKWNELVDVAEEYGYDLQWVHQRFARWLDGRRNDTPFPPDLNSRRTHNDLINEQREQIGGSRKKGGTKWPRN